MIRRNKKLTTGQGEVIKQDICWATITLKSLIIDW